MSDEVYTRARPVRFAAWTLRVEYEAISPQGAIDDPFLLVSYTGDSPAPSLPTNPDLPPEIDGIGEISDCTGIGAADLAPRRVPTITPPSLDEAFAPAVRKNGRHGLAAALIGCALIAAVGWNYWDISNACRLTGQRQIDMAGRLAASAVAHRIVTAESDGDATAKNPLSSATGAGQFLDGTWLDMIRAYRPDLAARDTSEILDLRRDPELSREIVARFAERNAATLVRRCLPVTPGTLYLSHFAGGAGAVAVLSAPEHADAAATMANADSTGRTTRDMIVTANPFLERFTVADLKIWADRKMAIAKGNHLSRM